MVASASASPSQHTLATLAAPHRGANGQGKGKGKARRPSSAGTQSDEGNGTVLELDSDGDEDFGPLQDYESALDSALALELDDAAGPSRAPHEHAAAGQASKAGRDEDDEEFLYDGKDDEDTRELHEEAQLHHQSYQDRLSHVLGDDDNDDDSLEEDKRDQERERPMSIGVSSPSAVEELGQRVSSDRAVSVLLAASD